MSKAKQVYVTYIRSTPEKVWDALTNPEMTRQYWGHSMVSDWKPGSAWSLRRISDPNFSAACGKVIECTRPGRLVLSWSKPQDPSVVSRASFDIEKIDDEVRLTVVHDELEPESEMLRGISRGWPIVLSSLKSLLETGRGLDSDKLFRR
ncbi:MAG TPA: SRPBCC family protein [Rhizomicrobium sp.]|nr:SRPBCC family protein [Rhizomicrobium sp.]